MKNVVFITGASSGIGRAVAKEFVKQGHAVFLTARREDRLAELARELSSNGGDVAHQVCDVTSRQDLDRAVESARGKFGKIDVCFANAGFGVAGRFDKLTIDDFRRQFETNVFGVLNTVYSSLNSILESKGSIVLMGSANSYVSEPRKAPYCMSKFAVKALADGLYWELKPNGVAVTLICPGIVESEIRQVDKWGKYDANAKDPAPKKLMMPTTVAAKKIVSAILGRKKEELVTFHGTAAVWAQRYAPFLLTPILKQAKPLSGLGQENKKIENRST